RFDTASEKVYQLSEEYAVVQKGLHISMNYEVCVESFGNKGLTGRVEICLVASTHPVKLNDFRIRNQSHFPFQPEEFVICQATQVLDLELPGYSLELDHH
ncbi:hypothetical protein RIF25_12635, partial [Thermosynechococcaceae cyanobacterium BACA0444]